METKFYMCLTCGNIVCKVVDSGVTPHCCGSQMVLLEPKSKDSGLEKHLPVVERVDACTLQVRVGGIMHPATKEHHIVFIALETKCGVQVKRLCFDRCKEPSVNFCCFAGDAKGVYAYCNIHGLWYKPINE